MASPPRQGDDRQHGERYLPASAQLERAAGLGGQEGLAVGGHGDDAEQPEGGHEHPRAPHLARAEASQAPARPLAALLHTPGLYRRAGSRSRQPGRRWRPVDRWPAPGEVDPTTVVAGRRGGVPKGGG